MYILVFVNVKFTNLHEQDPEKIHEQIEKKLPRLSPLLIKDWIKNFFHICPPRSFGLGRPQDYGWNALVFTRNFGLFIRTILWFMIIKVQFEWGFCDFERFEKTKVESFWINDRWPKSLAEISFFDGDGNESIVHEWYFWWNTVLFGILMFIKFFSINQFQAAAISFKQFSTKTKSDNLNFQ